MSHAVCHLSNAPSPPPPPFFQLSAKLFVAREFVEKHIRNKHAHVLEAERERLQDIVYWENFQCVWEEGQGSRPGCPGGWLAVASVGPTWHGGEYS